MTDLARLVVKLEAQTGQYQAALERAQGQLGKFDSLTGRAIGRIGGILAGISFGALIKGSIDAADHINDLSQRTGLAVESLSRYSLLAKQSGADIDSLAAGIKLLAKNTIAAQDSTSSQAEAFKALGVSIYDASGGLKTTDQLLGDLAGSFSGFEDGLTKSAAAQAIFGKTGDQLIPFLNAGREKFEALGAEADRLGITLSTSTAKAADQFNDSMAAVEATTTALVTNSIGPLLPALTESVDAFLGGATGAERFAGAVEVLQTGLKLIASIGLGVAQAFRYVGTSLGGIAAAAAELAQGHFRQAASAVKETYADLGDQTKGFLQSLDKLWSVGTEQVVGSVAAADQKLKKTLIFGANSGKANDIGDVVVKAAKVHVDAMQALYDDLDDQTKTTSERAIAEFDKVTSALDELYAAGRISGEEFSKRFNEAFDTLVPEVEVTAKKISGTFKTKAVELNEFQKKLAANTVDIIADTLNAAFDGSLKDIPKKFANMLLQLAIQAEAADLGKKLFGDLNNSSEGGGFGGLLGKGAGLLAGLFGGGRARGGPTEAGKIYRVNENTPNSEWFAPGQAGTIIPAAAGMGMSVINNFSISAPEGKLSVATQQQIAAAAARGLSAASRRNN